MNTIHFNTAGGFPLSTNILDAMQAHYKMLHQMGAVAGNFSIISGCEEIAPYRINDGIVFINGKIYPFKGGDVIPDVMIVREYERAIFENGQEHEIVTKEWVTFGSSTPDLTFEWDDFKRIATLQQLKAEKEDKTEVEKLKERIEKLEQRNDVIPKGLVAIWGRPASDIPAGWEEYTALRGRAPFGYHNDQHSKFNTLQGDGGQTDAILSIEHIPAHRHTVEGEFINVKQNDIESSWEVDRPWYSVPGNFTDRNWINANKVRTKYAGGKNHHSSENGATRSFEILPPYRVVQFIRYVGINP